MELARAYDQLVPETQELLRVEFHRRGLEPSFLKEEVEPHSQAYLVTVRHFRDLPEALAARAALEAAGLLCFLQDENMIRLDWGYSNALGGLRLQVPADQAALADELLTSAPADEGEEGDEESGDERRCPRCESSKIAREQSGDGRALVSLFLLALPLPLGETVWRCNRCGARWTDTTVAGDRP